MFSLQDKGISVKGKLFDTMVASYLLDPARTSYELEDVCLENLGHKLSRDLWQGLCERADCIFQLKDMLESQLKEKDLYELFEKIEMPLVHVLASMEKDGVSVDTKYLKQLSEEFEKRLNSLSRQIYEIAGEEFNINSPKQLGYIMFEKLHLPISKRTKTGPSTDVEVLEKLASKHALPATILEFRELAKLKSTYVDALPKLVDKKTHRIHT